MKCKKCRKTIPDGSKFCNYCGAPVAANKKLYRRKDGLYEKVLIIDGKRAYCVFSANRIRNSPEI